MARGVEKRRREEAVQGRNSIGRFHPGVGPPTASCLRLGRAGVIVGAGLKGTPNATNCVWEPNPARTTRKPDEPERACRCLGKVLQSSPGAGRPAWCSLDLGVLFLDALAQGLPLLRAEVPVKSHSSGLLRAFVWEAVVLGILVGLVLAAYLCRKPVLVTYHRWADHAALQGMRRYGAKEGQHDRFERYAARYRRHHEALIHLGYLERRPFHPKYLKQDSPQMQKMLAEFGRRCPRASYDIGWVPDRGAEDGPAFHIEDRPDRMPVWESLVREYDVPTVPEPAP